MNRMIASCAFAVLAAIAGASPLPEYPLVYANGHASAKMPPDTCTVVYNITIRDKESSNAVSAIEARSSQTLAFLLDNGIAKTNIIGFEIDKDIVRDYDKRDQFAFLGYQMTRRITFALHDLNKYEAIVSMLLRTPDVTDIRTSFDRTDRSEIEARLLAGAVSDAKTKAQLMADGSGQRIAMLRAISQHGFYNIAEEFGLGNKEPEDRTRYERTGQPQKELLFVPASIEFGNSVSVIYELEAKSLLTNGSTLSGTRGTSAASAPAAPGIPER
jgi:uncharacterized protein YggE